MINHLYFVRHGQSEYNAKGIRAGQTDVELTPLGREQAATAGKLLDSAGIAHMMVSDLKRARDTADIIAGKIWFNKESIKVDPRLREINIGDLVGKPDGGFGQYLKYLETSGDTAAETPEEVAERLRPVLKGFDELHGTLLIVAHAGVGRVMRAMLTGVDVETLAEVTVPNADPFELPLDRLIRGEIL